MTENQLIELCKKQQDKFSQIKKPHISPNTNKNFKKWCRNVTLSAGYSMLCDIEANFRKKNFKKV